MIGPEGLSAAEEARVRLLPFQVFSAEEDADELRVLIERLIVASLLGEETIKAIHMPDETPPPEGYTEAKAREIAELDDAAWVLWGSLTQAGRLLSVDLRLMAIEAKQPPIPLYMEAADREEMLSRVEEEMEKALSRILQRPKLVEIRVEGNRRIGKDAVLLRAKSRTGDDYSPYRLRKDIRAIDKMGYFEDVRLLVEDAKGGKVVTFLVEEKPSIREVVITGNNKISTDDIQEAITLQPQSILNYQVLQDTVEKIKKLYQEKGFYAAKVSYELRDLEGNQKGVILQVEEGKKFWIKTITFEGNEEFTDKQLKKVMESKEKDWLHWFTSTGVLDQETLRQDTERLAAYYYDHGFIRCRIGSPKIENDAEWIYITIGVEEGEQYTVSSIGLEGDLIEEEDLMKTSLKLKEGEPFNRGLLRTDLLKLTERYADQGYAYAEVKPGTRINDADRTVDVTLRIMKKQKVRIGRIRIMGNTKTRDKVIRREMVLSEGDTFSSMALKESNQRLRALKYFEEMNITTSPGVSDEVIDLNVEVKEQQTGTFSLGAGYSSVDSIIGVAEINQSNLFGRGYKVRLKAEVGGRKQFYDFNFVDPWFLDTRVGLRVDAYNTEREYDSYTRAALGGNLMFYFPLDRFLARLTGQLGYRIENVEVSDVDSASAVVFQLSEGESLTSQVIGGLTYDTRDNALYPNRGNISQLGVGFAGLGGDNRFGKYRINSAQYFPIRWGTVFMARGEFGFGHGWGNEKLPVFERFFLGGMHSIRGFKAGAVGPVDPRTGDVVGGDRALFFNFEYIFPILKKLELRGLVFYDTGNAWLGKIDITDMRHALGCGVRWYSPFGPIRVEIGFNLDPRRDEKPFEWGFGMGGSF
jgi:outer membrane protein insertion porin family